MSSLVLTLDQGEPLDSFEPFEFEDPEDPAEPADVYFSFVGAFKAPTGLEPDASGLRIQWLGSSPARFELENAPEGIQVEAVVPLTNLGKRFMGYARMTVAWRGGEESGWIAWPPVRTGPAAVAGYCCARPSEDRWVRVDRND